MRAAPVRAVAPFFALVSKEPSVTALKPLSTFGFISQGTGKFVEVVLLNISPVRIYAFSETVLRKNGPSGS
jgi:hypothetical protein